MTAPRVTRRHVAVAATRLATALGSTGAGRYVHPGSKANGVAWHVTLPETGTIRTGMTAAESVVVLDAMTAGVYLAQRLADGAL